MKRKDVLLHVAAMLLLGGNLALLRALPSSYMTRIGPQADDFSRTLSRIAWTGLALVVLSLVVQLVAIPFRADRHTRADGQKAPHV